MSEVAYSKAKTDKKPPKTALATNLLPAAEWVSIGALELPLLLLMLEGEAALLEIIAELIVLFVAGRIVIKPVAEASSMEDSSDGTIVLVKWAEDKDGVEVELSPMALAAVL